jgi:hypothetical protein
MKPFFPPLVVVLFSCFMALPLAAQVPGLINYQGRVSVGTVNFNGTGQFKFALVNGAGSATFWSNDNTSVAGSEPAAAVAIPVSGGLYSVLLGDTALPNMVAIPVTVFSNADVRLRVWFNDGVNGSQQLSPDQRIAAVGYAMMSASVQDGAITSAKIASGAVGSTQLAANAVQSSNIAAGAVGQTQIANGAVGASQIAAGAVGSAQLASGAALANLSASGQLGVPSGGMILSQSANDTTLLNAGYVKIGTLSTAAAPAWEFRDASGCPEGRRNHTAVWTGSEMIVWGGDDRGAPYATGGRYDPVTNTWSATTSATAPLARTDHTAVWTGTEMIVWGGQNQGAVAFTGGTGGRYNPATDSWIMARFGRARR